MGRVIRPDDESRPFVARWNCLVRVLLVEPSIKAVARAAMDHADFDDGSGVYPGNERTARVTGYSERAVREAWKAMRALGMAKRVAYGIRGRKADEYDLAIPDHWNGIPILGPNEGRFRCQHCDKVYNPSTNSMVLREDGTVGWRLWKVVFCPEPGKRRDGTVPESCFKAWEKHRRRTKEPSWDKLGDAEAWKLFYRARGDDW